MHHPVRRYKAIAKAISRSERRMSLPKGKEGKDFRISEIFGENLFDVFKSHELSAEVKEELRKIAGHGKPLPRELAEKVANATVNWAMERGVTHFCHWFQPLTGSTAEKHDSFISFEDERPIEKLSAGQLVKGEPDASSFPHGGTRSTFEARGYTSWDLTSPMFITEGVNGKTICIPTAFVSYHGDALDVKTPLLRSIARLNQVATKFLHLTGSPEVKKVDVTIGAEQEYFLVDKEFFYLRPDLIMCGKVLFGSLPPKNQQLEDHYFSSIPDRVLSFIQELEIELYRVGIPTKTRHNEVAPGQYEIAPIYRKANIACDQNQVTMGLIYKLALKHNFVALLHEKPFEGINGSGKHLNWSLEDDLGNNLLEPGHNPHENTRFLAIISIIMEALHRHSDIMRLSIAGHGNDHRLGANEAPPSILSIFLGDTLGKIFQSIVDGGHYTPANQGVLLDLKTHGLANLSQDNTDRNRTSPFAFTGNKFEFRAVGSSAAIGLPTSILNAAVSEIFDESNQFLEEQMRQGASVDQAMHLLIHQWVLKSHPIIFNGDGYGQEWVEEAQRRGLLNCRHTPAILDLIGKEEHRADFLTQQGIYSRREFQTYFNVLQDHYVKNRLIEYDTLKMMVEQFVIPAGLRYKEQLCRLMRDQKELGVSFLVEKEILRQLNHLLESVYTNLATLSSTLEQGHDLGENKLALLCAEKLQPLARTLAKDLNAIERIMPDDLWSISKYIELLFIR